MGWLRKKVEVWESSYQELSKAIDAKEERIASAHDADLQTLQKVDEECRNELRHTFAIENDRGAQPEETRDRIVQGAESGVLAGGYGLIARLKEEIALAKAEQRSIVTTKAGATEEACRTRCT